MISQQNASLSNRVCILSAVLHGDNLSKKGQQIQIEKREFERRLYAKSTGRLEYISHSYQQHKEPSKNLSGQLQVQQLLFAVFWNHLAPKGNPVQNKRRKQWLHVTLGISNFPFMKCYMPQTVQLFIRLNCNSSHASCKMKEAKEGNFQYTVG